MSRRCAAVAAAEIHRQPAKYEVTFKTVSNQFSN
jgi:hypothetical protein